MRIPYMAPLAGAALCFLLTGCKPSDMADANVLAQAREYFPLADVSQPYSGLLRVNTHVNNISEKFAAKVMAQVLTEHQTDLQLLPFTGYRSIQMTFNDGACGWNVDWQFFKCNLYATPQEIHAYSFYGTPLVNPDFTPPMPPPPIQ